jgi:hypothetical protein
MLLGTGFVKLGFQLGKLTLHQLSYTRVAFSAL